MNQKSYKVAVHAYPTKIKITLGPYVDKFLVYHPSKDLATDVSYIMKNRLPRLIGSVTERITTEIISEGMIDIDNEVWNLTSIPLREFEKSHSIRLLPDFGIYCDD
ncbi:MAG: hypothetical protein KGI02_09545, partial [Thaumarchaeota archaeon]|nr:hypothetical protein [Nitrososphaerota archaeon]